MYLLLTLGEYQAKNPRLAILDWKSKQIIDNFNYVSDDFPDITSNCFRGGTYYDGLFYACTFNEVVGIEIDTWSIIMKFSAPTFNDLHDVFVDKDGIWVCCTGLECIEHYSFNLDLLKQFNMCEEDVWKRFDVSIDHRLRDLDKRTTRRQHHVNNVARVDNEILVTRGRSESVSTVDGHVIINTLPGMPHDGQAFNGEFFLTTVKGFVEGFRVGTWERTRSYDLNRCYKEGHSLGWCRGLSMDKDGMFVGFTRFRPSKSVDFTRWIDPKTRKLDTRVVRYSFTSDSIEDEFVLKGEMSRTVLLYGVYPLNENKQII